MAAILSCGNDAALSHGSAAALLGSAARRRASRSRPGLLSQATAWDHCPSAHEFEMSLPIGASLSLRLSAPLIDLATRPSRDELEAAINAADKLDLVDPETLRSALDRFAGQPGVAVLRKTLDRRTFTVTDSVLERHFLPIARRAGLSRPLTGQIAERIQGRLLLAGAGAGRRDGRPALPPYACAAGKGCGAGSGAYRGGTYAAALPSRASGVRAQQRRRDADQGRTPALRETVRVTDPTLTGGCLCGGVRFELTAPPTSAGYCHCTRCQRRTGGGASAQARIDGNALTVLAG